MAMLWPRQRAASASRERMMSYVEENIQTKSRILQTISTDLEWNILQKKKKSGEGEEEERGGEGEEEEDEQKEEEEEEVIFYPQFIFSSLKSSQSCLRK